MLSTCNTCAAASSAAGQHSPSAQMDTQAHQIRHNTRLHHTLARQSSGDKPRAQGCTGALGLGAAGRDYPRDYPRDCQLQGAVPERSLVFRHDKQPCSKRTSLCKSNLHAAVQMQVPTCNVQVQMQNRMWRLAGSNPTALQSLSAAAALPRQIAQQRGRTCTCKRMVIVKRTAAPLNRTTEASKRGKTPY